MPVTLHCTSKQPVCESSLSFILLPFNRGGHGQEITKMNHLHGIIKSFQSKFQLHMCLNRWTLLLSHVEGTIQLDIYHFQLHQHIFSAYFLAELIMKNIHHWNSELIWHFFSTSTQALPSELCVSEAFLSSNKKCFSQFNYKQSLYKKCLNATVYLLHKMPVLVADATVQEKNKHVTEKPLLSLCISEHRSVVSNCIQRDGIVPDSERHTVNDCMLDDNSAPHSA